MKTTNTAADTYADLMFRFSRRDEILSALSNAELHALHVLAEDRWLELGQSRSAGETDVAQSDVDDAYLALEAIAAVSNAR